MGRGLWPSVAFAIAPALALGCANGTAVDPPQELEVGVPPRVPTGDGFDLGGEVSGLIGSSLVLRNGEDRETLTGDGRPTIPFRFPARVPANAPYKVTVETNPSSPAQRCTVVSGGEGIATADVRSVRVTCGEAKFTVGGTVRGLVGKITLQNNLAETIEVTAPAAPTGPLTFTFPTALESGKPYSVTRLQAPPGLTCDVTSGAKGTIGTADVTDVVVSCSGSQTFPYTGAVASYTVPAGVTEVTIEAWGAQGNRNAQGVLGGAGGYATGKLAVTGGDVLKIRVGGGDTQTTAGGFNGGGAAGASACTTAQGGGGGGASDVRKAADGLADRVIVAGGGGGAGGNRIGGCGRGTGGGGGGGWFGGGGGAGFPGATPGPVPTGGTQTAGGSAGTSTLAATNNGTAGASGVGGAGGGEVMGNQSGSNGATAGAAGGGPTGASGTYAGSFTGQSGAGGSGYIGGVTAGTNTQGTRSGAGQVIIRYGQ